MPRKLKLTPELIKEAVELVKMGNYTETVCQYLGIGETTWYRWMKEGENARSGIKREFWESIKRAESHAEIRNVGIIQKAAEKAKDDPKLWVAAMTFLERKFPDRWGKKDKVKADLQHSGEVVDRHEQNHNVNIKQEVKHTFEEYDEVISEVLNERRARRTSNVADDQENIN